MSSITVSPLVPHEMVIQTSKSSSAHVLRNRQVEILPSETGAFSFAGNDRIVINLSSQTEFLNAQDSYLKGQISCILTGDTGPEVDEKSKALDEGGTMSAFRNIELRTQSGVLLERWDRANRLYAMISKVTHPRNFVESAMGDQLDSVGFSDTQPDPYEPTTGSTTYRAARHRITEGPGDLIEFTMKIPLGFLNMLQYIPLMLIRQGLQLVLELDRPEFVMNSHGAVNPPVPLASSVTLTNVRYVANMITPDESVMQEYLKKYNEDGINYTFQSWRHRRRAVAALENSASNLSLQFGIRSARAVFAVIQSALLSDTASPASQNYGSLSTFLSTGVISYQFSSGSEEYPNHEVKLTDGHHNEAYAELMLAVNQYGSKLHQSRFLPYQFGKFNTVATVAGESTSLIMAADLSRSNSPWSGLDLSINNLDIELRFNAVSNPIFGNRNVNIWVLHDVMVSISQQNGVVVRK